ncbi:MAG: glycosyltransferase [Desulfovibrio sp.]|nr:glycosyltransferase [Desulfovibrio sp.]
MASETPAVSIIMNCLNSARDLRPALDSVMRQSFTDYEIIFFDNCSTDESPAIATSYPKVRYVRGTVCVPLGAARNLAIREARGKYIAFLDCDDWWMPEKLAKQVACFERDPGVGLVCTDTILSDGQHEFGRVFDRGVPSRGMVFKELMQRQWISMSSAMIRREALASLGSDPSGWEGGWFDETLNVCEEADVFYRIAHDWKLDHVDEPLTVWRIHGANTTFRHYGEFADETLAILEKHRRLYPGYDEKYADLVALLTRRAAFQKAVDLWHKGKGEEARRLLFPHRDVSRKYRLFYLISYLPGFLFPFLAKAYFFLPSFLRR